jgi:large subunit ribosomal protein L6e
VIATSTKVDLSKVNMPENLNDAFFNRAKPKKQKPTEGEIFEKKQEVNYLFSTFKIREKIYSKII